MQNDQSIFAALGNVPERVQTPKGEEMKKAISTIAFSLLMILTAAPASGGQTLQASVYGLQVAAGMRTDLGRAAPWISPGLVLPSPAQGSVPVPICTAGPPQCNGDPSVVPAGKIFIITHIQTNWTTLDPGWILLRTPIESTAFATYACGNHVTNWNVWIPLGPGEFLKAWGDRLVVGRGPDNWVVVVSGIVIDAE